MGPAGWAIPGIAVQANKPMTTATANEVGLVNIFRFSPLAERHWFPVSESDVTT
jgi:hypothetical protein